MQDTNSIMLPKQTNYSEDWMANKNLIAVSFDTVGEINVQLSEDENPSTVKTLIDALPFEGVVNTWGEEVYFEIPVRHTKENGRADVDVGEVAYWPLGNALCIFFGLTPASKGSRPRSYSPVNVIGRVEGELTVLRRVKDDCKVRVFSI